MGLSYTRKNKRTGCARPTAHFGGIVSAHAARLSSSSSRTRCRATANGLEERETHHNEVDDGVPVVDVLLNVDGEGRAHHGLQKEAMGGGGLARVGGRVLRTSESWCHGS